MDDVWRAHQTIAFCGVGAHHQNGVTERCIRDITENARTSLLHAAYRWPKAIAANLWPQPIKHVVIVRNSLPRPGKSESPLSKFAETSIQPNLKDFHPFGLRPPSTSRPEILFPSGENVQELAFSCAIPPIVRRLSHWSCRPKPVSSAHNSTVCSMTTLTWSGKSRQTQAFGKSKLIFRSPRKE